MLGMRLEDPLSLEEGGILRGMELLPTTTVLEEEKIRKQVEQTFPELTGTLSALTGENIKGYEIHMGRTVCENGETPGTVLQEQNVYGSYIHGIFDAGDLAVTLLQALARKKEIDYEPGAVMDYEQFKESQFDLLADTLREYLNMDEIYGMLQEAEYDRR